jgi:hypothetical protein
VAEVDELRASKERVEVWIKRCLVGDGERARAGRVSSGIGFMLSRRRWRASEAGRCSSRVGFMLSAKCGS